MTIRFKGSALAMVLLFVSTFALMTAGVGTLLATNANNVNKAGVEKRTRYAAYGAIQCALQNLNQDRNWDPHDTITNIEMVGDPDIEYTLRVLNNWSGAGPVTSSDGTVVPRFMVLLKAEGDYQNIRGGRVSSGLASMGYIGDTYFNYAAMGTSRISLSNNSVTDSYRNSTSRPRTNPTEPVPSGSPWARGNIITNGIGDVLADGLPDGITIANSTIKGHVTVGPNAPGGSPAGPPALRLLGTGEVLYDKKVNTGIKRVPRYAPPRDPTNAVAVYNFNTGAPTTLEAGEYRSVNVSNGSVLTLKSGDYFFMDSVLIENGSIQLDSSVNRDNPTSVYVGRSVTALNASVNTIQGKLYKNAANAECGPMTLRFFWVGTGAPGFKDTTLGMSNTTGVFCAAGKALSIGLNNTVVYGSLKGLNVSLNNSTIHYDKDLFNFLKLGYVAWNLQGLTTDSGDVMEDGAGDAGGDAGGDGGGDGGGG